MWAKFLITWVTEFTEAQRGQEPCLWSDHLSVQDRLEQDRSSFWPFHNTVQLTDPSCANQGLYCTVPFWHALATEFQQGSRGPWILLGRGLSVLPAGAPWWVAAASLPAGQSGCWGGRCCKRTEWWHHWYCCKWPSLAPRDGPKGDTHAPSRSDTAAQTPKQSSPSPSGSGSV